MRLIEKNEQLVGNEGRLIAIVDFSGNSKQVQNSK